MWLGGVYYYSGLHERHVAFNALVDYISPHGRDKCAPHAHRPEELALDSGPLHHPFQIKSRTVAPLFDPPLHLPPIDTLPVHLEQSNLPAPHQSREQLLQDLAVEIDQASDLHAGQSSLSSPC